MTSHYRHKISISVCYLLFCLLITSASARYIIRQFTDDFNTTFQQEKGAGVPNPSLDKAQNVLHKHQEVSSRDPKVSASTTVRGLRDLPPSSYSIKMESFNTLLKSTYPRYYESRRFTVGGYRWTLFVYPNGKEEDGGSGYLSLYVAIDSSSLVPAQPDVYADLRFYIFNNNEKKYFTIQDTNVWKFNAVKTMWGFSQALPRDTFKDPKNGYLFDGDHSEFGVDVTIPSAFKESEVFSLTESFPNPIFSRRFLKYSMLDQDYYMSDMFTIGGRSWNLQVNPNSQSKAEGNYLMMYLFFNANGQKMKPYDKFYVRAKLRVLSQRQENNFERQLDAWYMGYEGSYGWGVTPFMPLSELRDPSKGFLVNDMLNVEVELKILSSTKYLPP